MQKHQLSTTKTHSRRDAYTHLAVLHIFWQRAEHVSIRRRRLPQLPLLLLDLILEITAELYRDHLRNKTRAPHRDDDRDRSVLLTHEDLCKAAASLMRSRQENTQGAYVS